MPYPYDPADLAAIDRLANFYNGGDYDASTNPGGMGRGGHRINFENALADAARVGAANAAAAADAGTSATNAENSASEAALSAAKLIGTSTSSVAIGSGSKAFVTQAGKFFAVGTFVLIYSAANPTANYMAGQVTAYSGTDLTVDVTVTKGSGSFTDWVIAVAGAPGATGLTGLTGPVGPTPDIMVTFSDGVTDADPGNGLIKFNNAAPAATTQLYVDNLDRYGTSIASWLDSFDDSTNTALRGTVKLVQVSDPTKYARFNVVGAVVDGTGYRKIPVAHVLSNGTFTAGAILAIDFVRTGNAGLNGDGAGDVLGPAVSVDGHVALFDGTTGKLLRAGGALAAVATTGSAADVTVAPSGGIAATNVQAALAELDGELIRKDGTTTITADIPLNNKKITGLADAAAATDAMNRQASDARYLQVTKRQGASGQQIIRTVGFAGGNSRYAEVLESNASYSVYNYDASGGDGKLSLYLENQTKSFSLQDGAVAGNSGGQVTIPGQPAFSVRLASDLPIANGSAVLLLTSVSLNRGTVYNTATGRFTAPVTGAYYFEGQLEYVGGTDNTGSIEARFTVNGSAHRAAISSKLLYFHPLAIASVIQLTVGDYVDLRYAMTSASGTINLMNFNTAFSGHLIG